MIDSRIGPLDVGTAVRGYLRYSHSLRTDDEDAVWEPEDPDTAAYKAVENAIREAPALTAWTVVRALLQQTEDRELDVQAAGPLEELVRRRGAELIGEIEAEAERDPRFRWALGCIWLRLGDLPTPVLERVVQASGGEIKPLPPLAESARRRLLNASDG